MSGHTMVVLGYITSVYHFDNSSPSRTSTELFGDEDFTEQKQKVQPEVIPHSHPYMQCGRFPEVIGFTSEYTTEATRHIQIYFVILHGGCYKLTTRFPRQIDRHSECCGKETKKWISANHQFSSTLVLLYLSFLAGDKDLLWRSRVGGRLSAQVGLEARSRPYLEAMNCP